MTGLQYCMSLDVGSEQDPSALSVLSRREMEIPGAASDGQGGRVKGTISAYDLVHLERFELRTPYEEIHDRCGSILHNPKLIGDVHFVIDATGVGNPIAQMMYALGPIPIVITSGNQVNERDNGGYNVPKRDVVTVTQSVFQSGRIRIGAGLQHIEQLKRELLGFKPKPQKSGRFGYEAETESTHDDLVMSIAIAIWYMERLYGYVIPATEMLERPQYDPFEAYYE